jgi:hypothetical protein
VHSEFATSWIRRTCNVGILAYASSLAWADEADPAPSWVPRFDVDDGSLVQLDDVGHEVFRAGRNLRRPPILSVDGKALALQGIVFDKIRFRSDTFIASDFQRTTPRVERRRTRYYKAALTAKWANIAQYVFDPDTPNAYGTEEWSLFSAFAAALTALASDESSHYREDLAAAILSMNRLRSIMSRLPLPAQEMLQQRAVRACEGQSERDIEALVGPGLVKRQFIGTESGFLGLAPPT